MTRISDKMLAGLLVAAVLAAIAVFALTFPQASKRSQARLDAQFIPDGASVKAARFSDIPGWRLDPIAEALPAFLRSCERLAALPADAPVNPNEWLGDNAVGLSFAGKASEWQEPCREAARVQGQPYSDASAESSAARAFFEFNFTPFLLVERKRPQVAGLEPRFEPKGRFTAYFEPVYEAQAERSTEFSAPVYARPFDLVSVDLGRFRPELAGQRIAGRVVDGALDPYPDHAAINAGAVAGKARILAYMRPTDLLFLQIQGSGRLTLPEGELRVGYDGANGQPYTAIGRTLFDMGALKLENVSMKSIRAWLDEAKDSDAQKVRESNASYVFFRVLDGLGDSALGPLGAEGIQLTPGRSIAVDPRYIGYGVPVWVSIDGDITQRKEAVRRLMIAQDTGGAIKGPVRGDLFVGTGRLSGDVAGNFNEIGEMYILVPRSVGDRLGELTRS